MRRLPAVAVAARAAAVVAAFVASAVAAFVVTAVGADEAAAQTIYRCGSTYTRVPCSGGKPLDVGQPTTAAQRAEARTVAARERRLAAEMEHDRRAAEASQRPADATGLGPAAASKPAVTPKAKKRARIRPLPGRTPSGDFIARPPAPPPESKRPPPN